MSTTRLIDVDEFIPLRSRHIEEETCRKYGYGIGSMGTEKVQIAPYYYARKLVAQHTRSATKQFTWRGTVGNLELFGQHLWAPGGKRIVVTEGEIDAMSIAQALGLKWPVVSIPSGVQSAQKYLLQNLEWLESFQEIVIAFDDDKPGRTAVEQVAPLFTPGKVKVLRYDGLKDANEVLVHKGPQALVAGIYQASAYRPDGILDGRDMWELIKTPPQKGLYVSYTKLSEMLYGFHKGSLYLFTAGSGIGKSTLVNEIAYELMTEHGQKLGVMALEESPKRAAERYIGIALDKPIHLSRDGISEGQLRAAYEATVGSGKFYVYDHWGSMEVDNLLAKLRYMVVGLGVDWIVLDHISIVVSGMESRDEGERKQLDILMTKLRALTEATGVGMLAVVHVKRTDKNYNEGAKIGLNDLRGSASLEQFSDAVIGVERNQQGEHPEEARLRVLKNRLAGKTGVADTLIYNAETGRLRVAGTEGFVRESDNTDF